MTPLSHRRTTGVSILGMLLAIPVLLLLLILLALGFYEARKAYWDYQVRELCAKDGGIRVYEAVELPPEKFNQWGQLNFYQPTQAENALGAEYIFKLALQYFKKENPSLHRFSVQVIRRSDEKLLGESIGYSRGGGDIPGPWQPSTFSCPNEYGDIPLLTKVFIQSNKE